MSGLNLESLKEQIKKCALAVGIDKIGFTDAGPVDEYLPRLLQRRDAGYRHALNEGDPYKRVNPKAHLPQARSVISAAVAYPWLEPADARGPERGRGRFSFISRGTDYHVVVTDKLKKLRDFILCEAPGAQVELMTDRAELLEKALAVKAGLGWFGKNTLLVTPEFGSWVCLGELVTDIPLPPDPPFKGDCGNCRGCIVSCPAKALDEEGNLNPDRCLAGLTQSKVLPDRGLRVLMGTGLYGCDICQQACPRNKEGRSVEHAEFRSSFDDAYPLLTEIIHLSNTGFRERFGHTAGAWRGRTTLQRNAVIAAGNLGDPGAGPELAQILHDDKRTVMRAAAAWALGRIGTPDAARALEQAHTAEESPEVMQEISLSLRELGKTPI